MTQFKDARYDELHEMAMNIFNSTKAQVEEYFNNNFYGKYKVISFNTRSMRIGVLVGTYKDGETPRYRDIDIYHGYDYKYIWKPEMKAVKYFRFETNIGGCGSFDILGESEDNKEIYDYYMMVANILSNKEFSTGLKEILTKMADDIAPLNDEMEEIARHYNELEAKKIADENAKAAEEAFKVSAEKLANAGENDFVLIKKGCGGKFNYRRMEVQIVEVGSDYNALDKLMWKLHRETGIKMAVVEVSKVKLAA